MASLSVLKHPTFMANCRIVIPEEKRSRTYGDWAKTVLNSSLK
jgi:hypothetical protein